MIIRLKCVFNFLYSTCMGPGCINNMSINALKNNASTALVIMYVIAHYMSTK